MEPRKLMQVGSSLCKTMHAISPTAYHHHAATPPPPVVLSARPYCCYHTILIALVRLVCSHNLQLAPSLTHSLTPSLAPTRLWTCALRSSQQDCLAPDHARRWSSG
jgi:hypothetical protein